MNKEEKKVREALSCITVHNDAVEMAIIGTIISIGNNAMEHASQMITKKMFYQPANAMLFGIMDKLLMDGKEISMSSVAVEYIATEEGARNPTYIMEVINYNQLATLDDNIAKLYELSQRREVWQVCNKYKDVGVSLAIPIEETKENIIDAVKNIGCIHDSVKNIHDALKEVSDRLNENMSSDERRGIPTGFNAIDERGGRFQEGDLVVIAAESSQGKTSFALDIATNAAKYGIPVSFYSMEMTQAQIASRMISAITGIPSKSIMNDNMADNIAAIDKAIGQVEQLPMFFDDDSTVSVDRIYQSIRQVARRNGVKLVVVDYLQILSTNERVQNTETFYGEVARKFKNLAKELRICIVLLSQLARDPNTTEPSLRRIRGSGQINEAADWTFTIYRPEVYGKNYTGQYSNVTPYGTALIKCEKGRNVGLFDFICGFNKNCTHFYDTTPETIPQGDTKPPF